MYCPSCGYEAGAGLRFCKRCGGNLSLTAQPGENAPPVIGTGAVWAVAIATIPIVLGGLGITFSFAHEMARSLPGSPTTSDATAAAVAIAFFGSLTIFGAVFMLIRLATRLLGAATQKSQPPMLARPSAVAIPPAQLHSPSISISSVTEHTTRNFEPPRYHEPGTRE